MRLGKEENIVTIPFNFLNKRQRALVVELGSESHKLYILGAMSKPELKPDPDFGVWSRHRRRIVNEVPIGADDKIWETLKWGLGGGLKFDIL